MRAMSVLFLVAACLHGSPSTPSMVVEKDGAAVWPPQGEGCAGAVTCCDAMAALQPSLALGCQLAAAAGGSCAEIQATTMQIFRELAKNEPPCEAP